MTWFEVQLVTPLHLLSLRSPEFMDCAHGRGDLAEDRLSRASPRLAERHSVTRKHLKNKQLVPPPAVTDVSEASAIFKNI